MALVSLAALLSAGGEAGAAKVPTDRIAGGYYAPGGVAPWVTSIESADRRCTASLIAPRRVLTAAHCIGRTPAGEWAVRVGVRNRANPYEGEIHTVSAIAKHPRAEAVESYRGGVFLGRFDVAVMFLDRPSRITPAVLGGAADRAADATAMGWGHYTYDEPALSDPRLKAVTLRLGSSETCAGLINGGPQEFIPDQHLCTYDSEGDDCITQGDSGGPLFVDSAGGLKLVGVTSFYATQHEWGPCGIWSTTGFAWVAGPTLRSWTTSVHNPTCNPARRGVAKARRTLRTGGKQGAGKRVRRAAKAARSVCSA